MHEILCSSGALLGRANGRDPRLLEKYCPRLACDGFEFILYEVWYPEMDWLTAYLIQLKLHIPVMHCEKTFAEHISRGGSEEQAEARRKFIINCELARELGADRLVIHLWNGVISDRFFSNNLAAYGELREISERYGLDLLVENVVCREDPMSHWAALREQYPEIHFVFDTKMAQFHRQVETLYDPAWSWLWKEDRIRHYHVNDYGGGYMDWDNLKVLALGEGNVDFDRFFAFVKSTGYRGDFTFEATGFGPDGIVNTDRLNRQFDRARGYLAGMQADC